MPLLLLLFDPVVFEGQRRSAETILRKWERWNSGREEEEGVVDAAVWAVERCFWREKKIWRDDV